MGFEIREEWSPYGPGFGDKKIVWNRPRLFRRQSEQVRRHRLSMMKKKKRAGA